MSCPKGTVEVDLAWGLGFDGVCCARQLEADTLVLAVEMLLELLLLNRVNADDDVAALDVVDVELRQLLEAAEGRPPLRVLCGDKARGDLARAGLLGFLDSGAPRNVPMPLYMEGGEYRLDGCRGRGGGGRFSRRPLFHSSPFAPGDLGTLGFDLVCERPDGVGTGAFKPMIRFVTLFAVADGKGNACSSIGDVGARSPAAVLLCFPKPNLHLDGFFTTGAWLTIGTGGTSGSSKGKSLLCFEEDRDALLISRARDSEADARLWSVSSRGDPGLRGRIGGTTPAFLPFLAPRLRRLLFDVEREYMPSSSWS